MKILWIKPGGLLPLDSGGKIRSYHILRELARRHEITFATTCEEQQIDDQRDLQGMFAKVICYPLDFPSSKGFAQLAHYSSDVLTGRPHQLSKYTNAKLARELRKLLDRENVDAVVCDFLTAAGMVPWELPVPKILFTHNVEALIWKRHSALARNPLWKAVCWREYRTMARAERRYLNLADHVLAVSDTDRDLFAKTIDPAKITVIPTGVDLEFFQTAAQQEQPDSLVFTGSMDWMPNEEGILHFAESMLPLIRKKIPNVSVVIVGRRPTQRVLALARTTPGIHVTGTVDDIRPYVARGAVYIVPLRVGSGTRLKIFEAMSMGKAVVSTTIGAEGLPVQPGRDVMIADNPETFASAVVTLLQDPELRRRFGLAARELVAREHGWESVTEHFESVLEKVTRRHAAQASASRVGMATSAASNVALEELE